MKTVNTEKMTREELILEQVLLMQLMVDGAIDEAEYCVKSTANQSELDELHRASRE